MGIKINWGESLKDISQNLRELRTASNGVVYTKEALEQAAKHYKDKKIKMINDHGGPLMDTGRTLVSTEFVPPTSVVRCAVNGCDNPAHHHNRSGFPVCELCAGTLGMKTQSIDPPKAEKPQRRIKLD